MRTPRSARSRAWRSWVHRDVDEAFDLISVLASLGTPIDHPDDAGFAALFAADQADRADGDLTEEARDRDRARRSRGMAKLAAGDVRSARDFYHLAMLLQHGALAEHHHLAYEMARRSARAGYRPGRWLSAAAHDRWLTNAGLPQRYGTQYEMVEGRWALSRVDTTVDDAERRLHDVPPLADALRRAEEMNAE